MRAKKKFKKWQCLFIFSYKIFFLLNVAWPIAYVVLCLKEFSLCQQTHSVQNKGSFPSHRMKILNENINLVPSFRHFFSFKPNSFRTKYLAIIIRDCCPIKNIGFWSRQNHDSSPNSTAFKETVAPGFCVQYIYAHKHVKEVFICKS